MLLSGGGRTLTNLLNHIDSGELDARVVSVIASRECKGLERAAQAGLEHHLVPYRQMPDLQTYSDRISELLDAAGADLVTLGGFLSMWLIPPRYEGRVINIHPALLPAFGGKGMYGDRVHEAVLASGCKVSGCTVHFVNNEYDSGPIIAQQCVPVEEGDTPAALAARVFEAECELYPRAISLFAAGRLQIDGRVVRVTG